MLLLLALMSCETDRVPRPVQHRHKRHVFYRDEQPVPSPLPPEAAPYRFVRELVELNSIDQGRRAWCAGPLPAAHPGASSHLSLHGDSADEIHDRAKVEWTRQGLHHLWYR